MDSYYNVYLCNSIHVNFLICFTLVINTLKVTNNKTITNFLHSCMCEDISMADYVSVSLFWPPECAILFLVIITICIFIIIWTKIGCFSKFAFPFNSFIDQHFLTVCKIKGAHHQLSKGLSYVQVNLEMDYSPKQVLFNIVSGQIVSDTLWKWGEVFLIQNLTIFFIPKSGRKHFHTNSCNISPDDHLTAGAWAACDGTWTKTLFNLHSSG